MFEIHETSAYSSWISSLRDVQVKARIGIRIRRITLGNFGDVKPVGEGVSELRIHFGAGYRVYLTQRGSKWIVLLGGGDKATQRKDIAAAIALSRTIEGVEDDEQI
jgi:putative addiction module killer protein